MHDKAKATKRKGLVTKGLFGALAISALSLPSMAQAQSAFTCDGTFYQVRRISGTTTSAISMVDLVNNEFDDFGVIGERTNAWAYNTTDNLVYGVGANEHLYQFDSTGSSQDLGTITGLPNANTNAGTFVPNSGAGPAQLLHVKAANGANVNRIYRIDVTATPPAVVSSYPLSSNVGNISDIAYNPVDGLLYGENLANELVRINPTSGATSVVGTIGGGFPFGAFYADSTGRLFGISNSSGIAFEVNPATGVGSPVGQGFSASGNDGFNCSNAALVIPNASIVTEKSLASASAAPDNGDIVTFEITITNNGPANATSVTLTDTIPVGLTATTNNGNVTAGTYAPGTGIWIIPSLANGASATLTIEGTVKDELLAATAIDNITTAAVAHQPDPDTVGDDLTEGVTVASFADLAITKTNTPGVNGEVDQASDTVTSGTTTTYQLTVTNLGPDAVTGAIVTDTASSGLTCPPGNAVSISGDGIPVGSYTFADLTGAGIVLGNLGNGQATILSYDCLVN